MATCTEADETQGVDEAKGAVDRDALALLQRRGLEPARVVEVHIDAVMWLNKKGRPKTTFVRVEPRFEKSRIVTHTVAGFVV